MRTCQYVKVRTDQNRSLSDQVSCNEQIPVSQGYSLSRKWENANSSQGAPGVGDKMASHTKQMERKREKEQKRKEHEIKKEIEKHIYISCVMLVGGGVKKTNDFALFEPIKRKQSIVPHAPSRASMRHHAPSCAITRLDAPSRASMCLDASG